MTRHIIVDKEAKVAQFVSSMENGDPVVWDSLANKMTSKPVIVSSTYKKQIPKRFVFAREDNEVRISSLLSS